MPATVSGVTVTRINDTSIDISWTPLTLLEARGFFNYTVILVPSNNQKRQTSLQKIVPFNESNVVFSGLDPGVSYSVSVYANTIGGAGEPNITVIPPAVPPTPITGIQYNYYYVVSYYTRYYYCSSYCNIRSYYSCCSTCCYYNSSLLYFEVSNIYMLYLLNAFQK